MRTAEADLNKINIGIVHLLIILIILLLGFNYFFDLDPVLDGINIILITGISITLVLKYKQFLLFSLGFLIPISIPVNIGGGTLVSLPSEIICALLSIFFFAKLITGKKITKALLLHPITILIIADLAWLLITSCFSQLPLVSFKRLIIKTMYYIAFYYFYFELFKLDLKNVKKVFLLQCLGLCVPIIYTLIQHSNLNFKTVGSQLLSSPFYNDHTMYGAVMAIFFPFLFFNIFKKGTLPREKILYALLCILFSIAIFFSYSRAAWVSLIIGAIVSLLLIFRIRLKTIFILIVFGLALVFLNLNTITNSFLKNKQRSHSNDIGSHFKSVSNINTDDSNKERINRWKCAWLMFRDKPLLGFGPGTYQFFYGPYQVSNETSHLSSYSGTKGHAHSEYLNYLSETGLPGFLIFVALISAVFITALKLIRKTKIPEVRHSVIIIFIGLLTFFIHAFFNGFLEFDKLAMPVITSIAAITFFDLYNKSRANENTTEQKT